LENGALPKNEYNNFDLFSGSLPEGVVHLALKWLP
jgi:hypothetical protein